jgi:GTP-binding protein EngB required for normal cell division
MLEHINLAESDKEAILFIGVSGAGKSSIVNRLLGEHRMNVSTGGGSATINCEIAQVNNSRSLFDGWWIVDTPGLNDTRVECNTRSMFERLKLFFLNSFITTMRCLVINVCVTEQRIDHFERLLHFYSQLFEMNDIKRNTIVLVTCVDALDKERLADKLSTIRTCMEHVRQQNDWNMTMVYWSNTSPSDDQERQLFSAVTACQGFELSSTLAQVSQSIEREAKALYEAPNNWEQHSYLITELHEKTATRYERCTDTQRATFKGHFVNNVWQIDEGETAMTVIASGATRLLSVIAFPINFITGDSLRQEWKQTKQLIFGNRVIATKCKVLDVSVLHDPGKLVVEHRENIVMVTATFSWRPPNPVLHYNVDVEIEAELLVPVEEKDMIPIQRETIKMRARLTIEIFRKQVIEKRIAEIA